MKKHLLLFFISAFIFNNVSAQFDLQCSGRDLHSIYINTSAGFYRVDSVDTNPTSPVLIAPNPTGNGGGISIGGNLSFPGLPEVAYYIAYNDTYYYWNGSTWTNTLHTSGSPSAINPGGTFNYIYNLDGVGSTVYRYDGSGSGVMLTNAVATANAAAYDIATDNQDNFYILYTTNAMIVAFNSLGNPLDTFTTTGFVSGAASGIAIIGNNFYATAGFNLYKGVITGNNVAFSVIKNLGLSVGDIASCPGAANVLAVDKHADLPRLNIFPNPAMDVVTIRLQHVDVIEIIDCLGNVKARASTRGLKEYTFPAGSFKPGAYFIRASSGNNRASSVLMIQ